MASKNICCNSPRAIMLIYTYVQLWISRAIFSVLIILFTAALNLKISQECKSEWKRKKEKKSKTREICCDEVFVICPLQNSKKPTLQLPKSCLPFKKVVPF